MSAGEACEELIAQLFDEAPSPPPLSVVPGVPGLLLARAWLADADEQASRQAI